MMSPMRKIDEQVAQQIEVLKDSAPYQNFMDTYASLEDYQQDIVKFAMMVGSLLIPAIFLFGFYFFSSYHEGNLYTQEQIIYNANQIIAKKTTISKSGNVLSPFPIGNRNSLEAKIAQLGVNTNNVRVSNDSFNLIEDNGISEMQANLEFKDLTSEELFDFINKLTFRAKFKFREILINKNTEKKLLEGTLGISQFSRATQEQE